MVGSRILGLREEFQVTEEGNPRTNYVNSCHTKHQLSSLISKAPLPHSFPAAIFLVVHSGPGSPGLLPDVIRGHSNIPIANAYNGEPISAGRIYVAPPDHHLILRDGVVEVSRGPKENRHRPSIDMLFRSAAIVYSPRVLGVILSGGLNDGSEGLAAVRAQGGLGIVQDPDDALVPAMPSQRPRLCGSRSLRAACPVGFSFGAGGHVKIDERTVERLYVVRIASSAKSEKEIATNRATTGAFSRSDERV